MGPFMGLNSSVSKSGRRKSHSYLLTRRIVIRLCPRGVSNARFGTRTRIFGSAKLDSHSIVNAGFAIGIYCSLGVLVLGGIGTELILQLIGCLLCVVQPGLEVFALVCAHRTAANIVSSRVGKPKRVISSIRVQIP